MILQHVGALNARQVVLASASPRRSEILSNIGLKFKVVVSNFEEDLDKSTFQHGGLYAAATSAEKAKDVGDRCADAALIIAADTVVECDGQFLEKAESVEHAKSMLSMLSGRQHQVHTGVCLLASSPTGKRTAHTFHETTLVKFEPLSNDEIDAYLATGAWLGKAGSYGIQGPAGAWVSSLSGCYFNVMGLPLNRFSREVAQLLAAGQL